MLLRKIIREIFRGTITKRFTNSKEYWEERYYYGGNSGRGSYDEDAKIKSDFLNDTVLNYNIENILENFEDIPGVKSLSKLYLIAPF